MRFTAKVLAFQKHSRAKPSNSREMMEIVTREELWDKIGSTFYVNEQIGYISQTINKAKSFFLITHYFIFD